MITDLSDKYETSEPHVNYISSDITELSLDDYQRALPLFSDILLIVSLIVSLFLGYIMKSLLIQIHQMFVLRMQIMRILFAEYELAVENPFLMIDYNL